MSGEFLVSEDLTTWEIRSQLPIADFAVSPTDPDVIIATTERGLAQSSDGGRTFTPVSGSPLLQLVSWAEDGTTVGAAPDGAIYTSPDAGASWTERAGLGAAPEALTAESATQIYAAAEGRIVSSDDGGDSFTSVSPR
ncbi:MAG: hypothetical protein WKF79_10885 [Nocardioides sp.]